MKIKTLLFLAISITAITVNPCIAQDTTKPGATKPGAATPAAAPAAQLSEKEWKALEGFFTSPQNQEMKVQFTASDGMLVAKLLWNGGVVHLVPSTPLTFTSKEMEHDEPIRLTFHRDPSGVVNQVEVDKNGVWTRAKNYTPDPPKKEIARTPEQLKPFEGLYQAQYNKTLFLQFTIRDNHLLSHQQWNDIELTFSAVNDTSFFSPAAPNFTLDFQKDGKGNVVKMIAFKRDLWLRKLRPHFTDEQLKVLSGVYVSKDDPDNAMRLTAKADQLILTQLWDKKEIVLDALADDYFYNAKESYPLVVMKDDKGDITSIIVLTTNTFVKKEGK